MPLSIVKRDRFDFVAKCNQVVQQCCGVESTGEDNDCLAFFHGLFASAKSDERGLLLLSKSWWSTVAIKATRYLLRQFVGF